MTDTQSLARRIAERLFNQDLSAKGFNVNDHVQVYRIFVSKEQAEQIIAAELAEHDRKVRELVEAAKKSLMAGTKPEQFQADQELGEALEALK